MVRNGLVGSDLVRDVEVFTCSRCPFLARCFLHRRRSFSTSPIFLVTLSSVCRSHSAPCCVRRYPTFLPDRLGRPALVTGRDDGCSPPVAVPVTVAADWLLCSVPAVLQPARSVLESALWRHREFVAHHPSLRLPRGVFVPVSGGRGPLIFSRPTAGAPQAHTTVCADGPGLRSCRTCKPLPMTASWPGAVPVFARGVLPTSTPVAAA